MKLGDTLLSLTLFLALCCSSLAFHVTASSTNMAGDIRRCGELACQKDSYQRSLHAVRVVSCKPRAAVPAPKGKADKKKASEDKAPLALFDVVLSDTILFPEGGGQPCDRGHVGGVPCIGVENLDGIAVHILTASLEEGSQVDVDVDWARRWDHCTQHSTQHLVTALATKKWGVDTISWYLGDSSSFLELGTVDFTQQQMEELEKLSNDAIRNGHEVFPTWHSVLDVNNGNVPGLRKSAKSLPESVTGPVRVITFEEIDTNTCCGTHVKSTAHLHIIKLTRIEKTKTSSKLHFIAADRVLETLGESLERDQKLTSMLSVGAADLVSAVETLSLKKKVAEKSIELLTLELVELYANMLRSTAAGGGRVLIAHRDTCDSPPDFFKGLASSLDATLNANAGALLLVTVGSDGEGSFLLAGPAALVSACSAPVAAVLEGRGGGRGDRYQGKCAKVSARAAAAAAAEAAIAAL